MPPDDTVEILIEVLDRIDLKYPEGAFLEAQRALIPHMRGKPYWRFQHHTQEGVRVGRSYDTRTEMLESFQTLKAMCGFLDLIAPKAPPRLTVIRNQTGRPNKKPNKE